MSHLRTTACPAAMCLLAVAAAVGVDVYHAVGQQDQDLKAASFRQLQPVQPQRGEDAAADIAYFVNDVSLSLNLDY